MSTPTVHLIGTDDLLRIPDYLALGAIVIVAPDRQTLRRWEASLESSIVSDPPLRPVVGLAIDVIGRRAMWRGQELALTPLEFRVMAWMAAQPGRAWSFEDLRRAGWGEGAAGGIDIYAVRSVVQRLRRKLRAADVPGSIASVRGFGFRFDRAPAVREGLAAVP